MPESSAGSHSFEELCLPHRGDLLNYAARLHRGARVGDAEDLVQESLIRAMLAWERWSPGPSGSPRAAARSWLFRIVNNTFIKQYHHTRVRARASLGYYTEVLGLHQGPQVLSSAGADPETARQAVGSRWVHGDDVFSGAVEWAVDALSAPHREVIHRHYVRGQNYATIAAELDVPIGVVKSRLSRARARLEPVLRAHASENFGLAARVRASNTKTSQVMQADADSVDGVVAQHHAPALLDAQPAPDAQTTRRRRRVA